MVTMLRDQYTKGGSIIYQVSPCSLSCQLVAVFNVVWVLLAPFSPPLSALIALKPVCNDLCYNTICATAPKQAGNLLMLMLETLPTINVLLSYQIKIASHS